MDHVVDQAPIADDNVTVVLGHGINQMPIATNNVTAVVDHVVDQVPITDTVADLVPPTLEGVSSSMDPGIHNMALLEMEMVSKQSWAEQVDQEQPWIIVSNKKKKQKPLVSAVLTGKRPMTRSSKSLSQ